jgi:hypothetical protein
MRYVLRIHASAAIARPVQCVRLSDASLEDTVLLTSGRALSDCLTDGLFKSSPALAYRPRETLISAHGGFNGVYVRAVDLRSPFEEASAFVAYYTACTLV